MKLVLAFLPFIAFAVAERLFGAVPGLLAGAAASVALLVNDAVRGKGRPKMLELATAFMFSALAAWALLGSGASWGVAGVRLRVDAGLLAIALVSLALRRPFTLQYAVSRVPPHVAQTERFLRTNMVITGAWAAAFAVLVIADALPIVRPELPLAIPVALGAGALVAAFKFSAWYPRRAAR
jgi:hypothetical protein